MKITVNKGLPTEYHYDSCGHGYNKDYCECCFQDKCIKAVNDNLHVEEDELDKHLNQHRELSKLAAELHNAKKAYSGDYNEEEGVQSWVKVAKEKEEQDWTELSDEDCELLLKDIESLRGARTDLESIIKDSTNPKDLSFGKKPPLSLVPPTAIVLISKAMEDGAKKRSPYNWRESKVSISQLLDKVLRHTYKFLDGQNNDEESGLPELAHAAADLAVLIDAIETDSAVDDRPKKGKTAELIKKHTNE